MSQRPALDQVHKKPPVIGHRYRALADIADGFLPQPPFPTGIERVALEGVKATPRRSKDGVLKWCFCCDTVLPQAAKSGLCVVCQKERKRLRTARDRGRDQQTVTVTRREVNRIYQQVDRLYGDLGRLTVAYNNGGDLRVELNKAMLAAKGLLNEVSKAIPRMD